MSRPPLPFQERWWSWLEVPQLLEKVLDQVIETNAKVSRIDGRLDEIVPRIGRIEKEVQKSASQDELQSLRSVLALKADSGEMADLRKQLRPLRDKILIWTGVAIVLGAIASAALGPLVGYLVQQALK